MSKFKRNAPAVLSKLFENATGQVLTKTACKIQVPVRFSEVGLGQIGINTFTYGLFALILTETNEYSVFNVNALVELNPYKVIIVTIDEVDYHEFYFEADQVIIKTTDLVQRETLMYNVIDEFIFKGKVPWYVGYEDMGKIFDTARYHAGSKVGQNLEVIEFLAAMVSRSAADRTKYIRTVANSYQDVELDKLDFVALKSVFYSVNSTVNKLAGSYFNDGVTSALVNPTDKVEKIERILRT